MIAHSNCKIIEYTSIVPTTCLFTFFVKDLEYVLLNIKSESAYEFEVFVDPK